MEAGLLRVMSFNIRGFSRRGDGFNSWENRAALNVATIKRYAPDLIGLQELQAESLATYREKLPEYAHILGPGAGNKNTPRNLEDDRVVVRTAIHAIGGGAEKVR